MLGKYDSYRDSALHFLCSAGWANESFGDVSKYGVFIHRISNSRAEVSEENAEFNSMFEEWEAANTEMVGTLGLVTLEEFRTLLVGSFMVSENSDGIVTVKKYALESELIRHFKSMQEHYDEFVSANEESDDDYDSL